MPAPRTCLVPARNLRGGLTIAAPVSIDGIDGTVRILRLPLEISEINRQGHTVSIRGRFAPVSAAVMPLADVEFDCECELDHEVTVLTAHYGVCAQCGAISPCPDEWAERSAHAEVEALFADLAA